MGKSLHHWRFMGKTRQSSKLAFLALLLATTGNAVAKPHVSITGSLKNAKAAWAVTVTGTVVDSKGDPLPGVTVKVKNGSATTITTVDGVFKLNLETGNEVLVFTYIGYKTIEVPAGGKTTLRSVLEQDISNLDDVVVIGFGTVKKKDLTGAVSSVKPAEITARPGPNPMESLQGRVAGLDITRTSGQPGQGVNIQLRGNRSIKADGNPLFIINGLPGDYATLNANDIESIDVLKDAASTAVYGSAGANGVILITTKSGKAGKLTVDFNSYYGYNGWSVTPEVLTGEGYLQAKREAYKYTYDAAAQKWTTTGALWQSPANDVDIFGATRYDLYKQGEFVNWADQFLRKNAGTQNYSLSIAGGTDATKAYISFNLQDEKGQYRGDQYKLYSTNIRIDHKIRKWVSVGGNLQASYVDRSKAQDKLENALVTDPLVRPYKADGTLNPDLGNNVYNLLLDYQPGVYENRENNSRIFFNPYLELRPIKGLTILSRAGIQLNYLNNYRFDGIGSVNYTYVNGGVAKAKINQNRDFNTQWENVLTYNFNVLKDHEFTFTGVTSYYNYKATPTDMTQNVTSNNFKWYNFISNVNTLASSGYSQRKTFAVLGRINYSYLGKYLFSASIRRDGASQLYYTNRYNNFPALSAGWRISDEKFMDFSKNWLNNLKLRASYGVAGTAKIDPYSSVQSLEQTNMSLGGEVVPIFRNSAFVTNADLTWEKSKNLNFGLDASLFKNRVDLTVEYYRTNTEGVIYNVLSPIIYGTRTPGVQYQTQINVAKTKNEGLEVTLNTRNIVIKDFEWTSSAAFSYNTERVVKIVNGLSNNIPNTDKPGITLSLGQPANNFWNYKLDGVWQIGEEADAAAFAKRPGDLKVNVPGMTKLAPGVFSKTLANGTVNYYYTNLTEAKKFNPALTAASSTYNYSATDYQIVGHNTPNWSLGFQNQFKYKNFDLTVYSYFRWGQTISYNMMGWYQPNSFAINASPSRTFPAHFNYWTPTNPSNEFPVMNFQASPSTMVGFSGLNYVDGSFFKIKNITLGYTLPTGLAKKIALQRLRLYATLTNPLIVAKSHLLKNYDPEMNGTLDYPLTKQAVVGLNVTF